MIVSNGENEFMLSLKESTMKNRVFITSCLICVILSIQPVYAEMHSLSEIRLYGWHVTLEKVYDLNEMYQKNSNINKTAAVKFLIQRAGIQKEFMIIWKNFRDFMREVFWMKTDVMILRFMLEIQLHLMQIRMPRLPFFQ